MFLLSALLLFGLLHIGKASSADFCDIHSSDWNEVERCRQLYNIVEDALVESDNNMYVLRESFFPSVEHPDEVLYVQYYIVDQNGSNNSLTGYVYNGYSKYSLFSIVSPLMIQALQSGLFELISNLHTNLRPKVINLILLFKSEDREKYNLEEIGNTLDFITPRLKVYASVQGRLTADLSIKNRGYRWGIDDLLTLFALLIPTLVLVVFTQTILARWLFWFFKHGQTNKHVDILTAFFYSCGLTAMMWNICELILNILVLAHYPTKIQELMTVLGIDTSHAIKYSFTRVFLILLGLFPALASGVTSCCVSKSLPRLKSKFCFCFCCCCCISTEKIDYCFHFMNIFYFTYSVTVNVIPTAILVIVVPLEVITVTCLFASFLIIILCYFSLVILGDIRIKQVKTRAGCWKMAAKMWFGIGLYLFPYFAVILITAVYVRSLQISIYSDTYGLTQVAASCIATVLAEGVGYVTKRKISKHNRKNKDDTEKGTKDATPSVSEESMATNKVDTGDVSEEEEVQGDREDIQLLMEEQTTIEIEDTQL